MYCRFQLSQTDELFNINTKQSSALTMESEISTTMQESAQELLNYYVRIQGLNVSQVILKSRFNQTYWYLSFDCYTLFVYALTQITFRFNLKNK